MTDNAAAVVDLLEFEADLIEQVICDITIFNRYLRQVSIREQAQAMTVPVNQLHIHLLNVRGKLAAHRMASVDGQ